MLKKITLLCCCLSSLSLQAGTMGCPSQGVQLDCLKAGPYFGMQALYLKPQFGAEYGLSASTVGPGAVKFNLLTNDNSFGFQMNGGYQFASGQDIQVNWYHYNHNTYHEFGINVSALPLEYFDRPRWDALNLEIGQWLTAGLLKYRYHGGLQFARIKNDYRIGVTFGIYNEEIHSQFNGLGPRLGLDVLLPYNNTALFIKAAYGLLAGDTAFRTRTTGLVDVPGTTNGSTLHIVNEYESKLGAQYCLNLPKASVILEAGFLWQHYLNASTFRTVSVKGNEGDFSVYGPYLGLKWVGYP